MFNIMCLSKSPVRESESFKTHNYKKSSVEGDFVAPLSMMQGGKCFSIYFVFKIVTCEINLFIYLSSLRIDTNAFKMSISNDNGQNLGVYFYPATAKLEFSYFSWRVKL